jgi:PAS domain S-box-containing protein
MCANTSRLQILVADPEAEIREGVSQILGRQGYEVIEARTGREALDILLQGLCELALIELSFPDMEGTEVLERLVEAGQDVDVIVLTGQATIEKAVYAVRLGALDVLTKPFVPWLLKKAVGRVWELRRLARERDRLARERQRGLWAITTEKSRLKAVINSMSEGVLITDQDGGIVLCNPAFTRLMEMDSSCVIGSRVSEHPHLAALHRLTDRMASPVEPAQMISQELKIRQDPSRYIRARVNLVAGSEGGVLGLVTVIEDITYLKEMDQKKSEFVAMVSHELKAPLAVLDTQAKVILKTVGHTLDDKRQKMLLRMQERIKGAVEMINDLLDLTRIEDQGVVRQKSPLNLGEYANEVCELWDASAKEKGHKLSLALKDGLPEIMADPGAIKEVLMNLVGNAVRYTPDGGEIKVATCLEKGYVCLEVSDNGIGVAPEDQKRIFDRFFRVKSEHTRHIVGTGLGLPIVKAIAEEHQGRISLESRLGKGSAFKVYFPALV